MTPNCLQLRDSRSACVRLQLLELLGRALALEVEAARTRRRARRRAARRRSRGAQPARRSTVPSRRTPSSSALAERRRTSACRARATMSRAHCAARRLASRARSGAARRRRPHERVPGSFAIASLNAAWSASGPSSSALRRSRPGSRRSASSRRPRGRPLAGRTSLLVASRRAPRASPRSSGCVSATASRALPPAQDGEVELGPERRLDVLLPVEPCLAERMLEHLDRLLAAREC